MAPSKTNKIKEVNITLKTYFLSYTTLPFGQKRFVHFKGPKNVLYHGLPSCRKFKSSIRFVKEIF